MGPSPMISFGLGDEAGDILAVGEVGGDVMNPVRVAQAVRGHVFARAGDDLSAFVAEPLHRRIADAAAGAGQHQPLAGVPPSPWPVALMARSHSAPPGDASTHSSAARR